MSQANRFNICIIPGGQGRVYSFHFHPVTLAILVGLSLAVLIFLIGFALNSRLGKSRFVDRSEVKTLKAANATLEAQTAAFFSSLRSMEDKLLRLDELTAFRSTLTDEIRVQLGLPREAPEDEVLPRLAAAVDWADRPGLGVEGPEGQEGGSRYLIRNLNRDLEQLMALADRVELDLIIINEGLSGAGSILAATPTILPLNKPHISSRFGLRLSPFSHRSSDFHRGIDIPATTGTLVRAPADGTVLASGYSGNGYGLLMTIDHGYGLVTRYGHLDSILVEAGQTVIRGQPVARSGNSGRTTGPHLHYEVLLGGVPTDPLELLAVVSPMISQDVKFLEGAGLGALPSGAGGP